MREKNTTKIKKQFPTRKLLFGFLVSCVDRKLA
jgi:hypothetical protein